MDSEPWTIVALSLTHGPWMVLNWPWFEDSKVASYWNKTMVYSKAPWTKNHGPMPIYEGKKG